MLYFICIATIISKQEMDVSERFVFTTAQKSFRKKLFQRTQTYLLTLCRMWACVTYIPSLLIGLAWLEQSCSEMFTPESVTRTHTYLHQKWPQWIWDS